MENALPELRCHLHESLGLLLHGFELGRDLFNRILPFSNLLQWRRWLDQGIELQIGVLELDNSFPWSLGLIDWG